MGSYLNPGNAGFQTITNGIYVDKTGLIDYVNGTINTPLKLTCFSRPRRFGKSFAAKMLCAYYDRGCDSEALFEGLDISKKESFRHYLNKLDVIYLDITKFISRAKRRKNLQHVVSDIQESVMKELAEVFSDCVRADETYLPDALLGISQKTGKQFVLIIDEWDALFREAKTDTSLLEEYIWLLRGLFKSGLDTDLTIAAAYMTGILPIKKYGTESALTDFREYTMEDPLALSEYIGFTESEVQMLCRQYDVDFHEMKKWYDGYTFAGVQSVYSPNSVINAVIFRRFKSYWTSSETYESLKYYMTQNFDGLKDAIIWMLGGQRIQIDTGTFQNDMTSFDCRDDVLTLLIHLGYLAYDDKEREVYIPNLEVAGAFRSAVKGTDWTEVNEALSQSEKLLKATIAGDTDLVASLLELAHETCASSLTYNDENSLSCAILLAYYVAKNDYEIIRELPAGKGFADYAFLPFPNTAKPALLIELKYNHSADSAIRQIKENRYEGRLKKYFGNLLLVGINYDKNVKGSDRKKHTCRIEQI